MPVLSEVQTAGFNSPSFRHGSVVSVMFVVVGQKIDYNASKVETTVFNIFTFNNIIVRICQRRGIPDFNWKV